MGAIGQPLRRKEDERLLTGKGRFSDDFILDGQAYAVLVRSPHPHARIVRINAESARSMPGVLGVLSGADCLADGLGPIPHNPVPQTRYDMKPTAPGGGTVFIGPHLLLPWDRVRHVGEAVAMVVAETVSQALDAAEAVAIEYEALPWNTDTMPTNAYRSSGRPEVTFALERLIDNAAADLGFDRIELRRMNLIRWEAMPYTNAVGMT